jgi:CRISPR/Cas system CSM-associated protein Csm4 (group 5 of RAMP superfamily)
MKSLTTKKISEPYRFTTEFEQTFQEELTLILFKLLPKIERKGMLPKLFHETSITQISKPDKDTIKK